MGRKLRTTHDALFPSEKPTTRTTSAAAAAAAKHNDFVVGSPVYARDYRLGHPRWIEATVTARRGDMLFDVSVGDDTWVRHRNQLRRRHAESSVPTNRPVHLPLHILLGTFATAPEQQAPNESTQTPQPPDDPQGSGDCRNRSRSTLLRSDTIYLQGEELLGSRPTQREYDTAPDAFVCVRPAHAVYRSLPTHEILVISRLHQACRKATIRFLKLAVLRGD